MVFSLGRWLHRRSGDGGECGIMVGRILVPPWLLVGSLLSVSNTLWVLRGSVGSPCLQAIVTGVVSSNTHNPHDCPNPVGSPLSVAEDPEKPAPPLSVSGVLGGKAPGAWVCAERGVEHLVGTSSLLCSRPSVFFGSCVAPMSELPEVPWGPLQAEVSNTGLSGGPPSRWRWT